MHQNPQFGNQTRFWWNRDRDDLIDEIVIPLVNKHVVATTRRGKKSLFNFGSVSYVTILQTKEQLSRPSEGKAPTELLDKAFVKEHNVTEDFVNEVRVLQSSAASRSLIEQALAKPYKQTFVIMQLNNKELDSAYEGVIKPVGNDFGFKVIRVDEIEDAGQITTQIVENISRSELVVAELSGERPNCYYEAGYAHALGKEMIFAIRQNETKHFDLAGYRFIEWQTEAEFRRKLRQRLGTYTKREEEH